MRKSSMAMGRRSSSHVTGVDTGARGRGRTEYTDANVRPHAFWLKSTWTRSRGRISLRYTAVVSRGWRRAMSSEMVLATVQTSFCVGPRTIGT